MTFVRGNKAIRDHMIDGRDLLLFEATKTKGVHRFRGCFAFAGWEIVDAPDRNTRQRKAIVFELVPLTEVEQALPADEEEAKLETSHCLSYVLLPSRRRGYGKRIQRKRVEITTLVAPR